MFDHGQPIDIPYEKPAAIYVRDVAQVMEAIPSPGGGWTMRFHHFDARELPIVALNRGRNFFLAKTMRIDGRNHLSTDLERI